MLGYGAYSQVFRARDTSGRDVTLKCPNEVILGDTATFERFRREMRIAERLDHPGIQRSLDRHAHRTRPYIVMEYVAGRTLRHVLAEEGPPGLDRAIQITCQVTAAMAYAHSHGVYHRDLKPENLLVAPDGHVVVTDFGVALLQGARRLTWRWLSQELGTPDYMAPEQVQGKRGDGRSDLYAVGVVLYEMLAGRTPWSGDSLATMSQKLAGPQPDISKTTPGIPPAILGVVRKCLRRDPAERYQQATALLEDLERWRALDAEEFQFGAERALGPRSESALYLVAAAVSLTFLLVSGLFAYTYYLVVAHR